MPLWVLLLSLLFILGAWSAWNAYNDYLQAIEHEYRLLEVRARQREARISGTLRSVFLMLGSVIEDQQDRPTMSVAENNPLLRNYLRQLPELRNLLIEDAAGVIRADARETSIGLDANGREYFKLYRDAPQNDEFHISRPFKAISGVTAMTLSRDFDKVLEDWRQAMYLHAAAAFESQEGHVVTDANNLIKRVNPSFTQITGYVAAEVIGRDMNILKSGYHDTGFYLAMWQTILGKGAWRGEIMNRTRSGEIHPHAVAISAVKDAQGVTSHYVGGYTDITERRKMEEQVRQMAFHDTLTGLPNRRLLSDRLNQTMATTKRSGCYGALMFLDLDNFKPLNDTHGHAAGDLLLIEVADRLRSCVREMDTVARFGGDEFVVMLGELNASKDASTTQARIVAEKIRATLSQPYKLSVSQDGKADAVIEHRCTASVGVALFIDHQASEDDILRWADSAMYQAKEAGQNLLRFHDAQA